jgi:tryptophanyl-tRNA synthetase
MTYFSDDDEKLKTLYDDYKSGKLLTGEMKKECIVMMQNYVKEFQDRRKEVTDEVLQDYMTPRKLEWRGNLNPVKPEPKPQSEKGKKGEKGKKEGKPKEEKAKGEASKAAV